MTDNEIHNTLKNISSLLNTMDQEHLKKLLCILLDIKEDKETMEYFPHPRKTARQILAGYENTPLLTDSFNHKQIKAMYTILGDYNCYPVCQLCGHPIKIDSDIAKHTKQSMPMVFTWDHIFPKSMGGETTLANLQPAHKICNNQKGSNPPEEHREHYSITVTIKMKVNNIEDIDCNKSKKHKKKHVGLRKQDMWCHKYKCCPCCCSHR